MADAASTPISNTTKSDANDDFSAESRRNLRKILEIVGWIVVAWLILVGITSIFGRASFLSEAAQLAPADPQAEFGPFDGRYYENFLATVLHLIPGLAIMLLGPLQFIRHMRTRHITFHRWSGRIFLLSGVIGALSGIVIGVFDPFMGVGGQGFNESMATAFFGAYTLFCLYMAYSRIRQRLIPQHREWMIRSWVLMLAIATERTILQGLMTFTQIDIAVLFGTTFWMAAVINVAAGEIWINLTRTPGKGIRHWKDLDAKAAAGA